MNTKFSNNLTPVRRLLFVKICPAILNIRSTQAELACTPRNFLANWEIIGNRFSWHLQKSKALKKNFLLTRSRYEWKSLI